MKIRVVDAICGAGKAQPLYSNILSKNGFIKMGEIKIGDEIYGEDGKLHNVIGVFPQGLKDIYEITFSDNSKTRCCKDHLWTYQLPQDRSKNRFRTTTTEDFIKKGLYKEFKDRIVYQYYIPISQPLKQKKFL